MVCLGKYNFLARLLKRSNVLRFRTYDEPNLMPWLA